VLHLMLQVCSLSLTRL
jgi:hypothetical protein